jgi:hypothetical protein
MNTILQRVIVAAIIGAAPALAQEAPDGEIAGTVVDSGGQPMGGQRIELQGPAMTAGLRLVDSSDPNGRFAFRRLPPGSYRVEWVLEDRIITARGPLVLDVGTMRIDNVVLVRPVETAERAAPEPPVRHRQSVTANPFFLLANAFNAEYERVLGPRTTWGVSGTLLEWDDFRYRTAKALVRLYPRGVALHGPFLGARAGVSRVADWSDDTERYFVLGVEAGFTDHLGSRQHIAASVGAGVNRLFGADEVFSPTKTLLAVRLNLGVAF